MAAGLGFKDFTTGEVLTAADVDGYLMQNIWVFATATARDAAVTSPQEGNFAFTKDNNSLWYYDGAAWVASGATGDIEGVTAGIGISGGGTSGTVTVTNSMATAIDAKGDLVAGTGADTFAKLTVGANNTVLTADSTAATGLKWATAASGGMTLIETLACSGSSVTSSSIAGTYKHLYVVGRGIYNASSQDTTIKIRLNSDSGSNYSNFGTGGNGGTTATYQSINDSGLDTNSMGTLATFDKLLSFELSIPRYSDSNYKSMQLDTEAYANQYSYYGYGLRRSVWNNTAAITTLTFAVGAGTYAAGNIYIYGVS